MFPYSIFNDEALRNVDTSELKGWRNEFVDREKEEMYDLSRFEALGISIFGLPGAYTLGSGYVRLHNEMLHFRASPCSAGAKSRQIFCFDSPCSTAGILLS
jgi:hypothetical protein